MISDKFCFTFRFVRPPLQDLLKSDTAELAGPAVKWVGGGRRQQLLCRQDPFAKAQLSHQDASFELFIYLSLFIIYLFISFSLYTRGHACINTVSVCSVLLNASMGRPTVLYHGWIVQVKNTYISQDILIA